MYVLYLYTYGWLNFRLIFFQSASHTKLRPNQPYIYFLGKYFLWAQKQKTKVESKKEEN
jgi:hypothetical protein